MPSRGLLESPSAPQSDTIDILELIVQARADLGVRYPGDNAASASR